MFGYEIRALRRRTCSSRQPDVFLHLESSSLIYYDQAWGCVIRSSTSLKYEPCPEPLHISVSCLPVSEAVSQSPKSKKCFFFAHHPGVFLNPEPRRLEGLVTCCLSLASLFLVVAVSQSSKPKKGFFFTPQPGVP